MECGGMLETYLDQCEHGGGQGSWYRFWVRVLVTFLLFEMIASMELSGTKSIMYLLLLLLHFFWQ